MTTRFSIRCPSCNAKLRAPRALLGRNCPCPQCKRLLVVREPVPSDADVAIVPEDAGDSPMGTWGGRW